MCYKILNDEVSVNCNLFDLSALTHTRGTNCTNNNVQSSVNAYTGKYFFSNRVCDIWNSLFVVEASSSDNFGSLLNQVICLRLYCCNDCVCIKPICFLLFFVLGIDYYISG